MGFNRKDVDALLVNCHRSCCVCHRFCGIKIETDHIIHEGEGGGNDMDNAIALCFECHSEVHMYNDNHPRGRKFTSNELRLHRDKWIELCKSPQILTRQMQFATGGPFYNLINELEYNLMLLDLSVPLENEEFKRSLKDGTISLLKDQIKKEIMAIYAVIKSTNISINQYLTLESQNPLDFQLKLERGNLNKEIQIAKDGIVSTLELIKRSINNP